MVDVYLTPVDPSVDNEVQALTGSGAHDVLRDHYFDETADASEHFSQIPEGFAGELSEHDNDRADASAWLDPIPVIREFRRKVLAVPEN
jgi:hypothetical protein